MDPMITIPRLSLAASLLLAACIKPIDDQADSTAGATSSAGGAVSSSRPTTPMTDPAMREWAKDEERRESGDPENPLGRAQLVYDPPRSIHGTNEPNSIGKAASHGSIRMRNEDIVALAREVMDAGGAPREAGFFEQVRSNRRTKQVVDLVTPVPLRIR
jgi:hypothetical protein